MAAAGRKVAAAGRNEAAAGRKVAAAGRKVAAAGRKVAAAGRKVAAAGDITLLVRTELENKKRSSTRKMVHLRQRMLHKEKKGTPGILLWLILCL